MNLNMLQPGRHMSRVDCFSFKDCHYLGLQLKAEFGSAWLLRAQPTHLDGLTEEPRFRISQPISSRSSLTGPSIGEPKSRGGRAASTKRRGGHTCVFSCSSWRAGRSDSGSESELDASLWEHDFGATGAASHSDFYLISLLLTVRKQRFSSCRIIPAWHGG